MLQDDLRIRMWEAVLLAWTLDEGRRSHNTVGSSCMVPVATNTDTNAQMAATCALRTLLTTHRNHYWRFIAWDGQSTVHPNGLLGKSLKAFNRTFLSLHYGVGIYGYIYMTNILQNHKVLGVCSNFRTPSAFQGFRLSQPVITTVVNYQRELLHPFVRCWTV